MSQIANKFLAQTPTLTLKGNNTGGTANVSDLTVSQVQTMLSVPTSSSPLSLAAGGTGSSYASNAALFNGINPMTTTGDLIYESATNTASRLPIGSTGFVLTVVSGVPAWSAPGTPTFSGLNQYGAIYAASTTTVASTAAGTSGYLLTANSSAAPTFSQLNIGTSSAITGTLAAAQFPALTGDVTTTAGSLTTTLATVNSNVGSFGSSTSIPSFTVNAKGLITAASGNVVVAPAGTLSGTTLNSTVVTSSLTSLGTQAQALNMGSNPINNVTNPTNPQDAATKNYVDSAINGLTWKGPVNAYANSNVPLTGGATLTIDGYSVQNGNYVILANQTTTSQQGVYSVSGIGTAYTLTAASGSEAATATGDAYLVLDGTVYGNSAFLVSALSPTTFIQFAGPNVYSFSSPLSLSGNTVSLTLNPAGAIINSSGLEVNVDTTNNTTKINGSNQLEAQNDYQESFTLSSGDITNQYKDLSFPVSGSSSSVNSVNMAAGGVVQLKGTDYTVSLTGGSGGVTRITFAGGLATGGNSALVAGDVLVFTYSYLP